MKKGKLLVSSLIVLSVFIGLVTMGIAVSENQPKGEPFQAIWNAIDDLQDQIDNIQISGWTDDGTVVRLTTSTDKVGIGTANPASQLQVDGMIRATNLLWPAVGTGKSLEIGYHHIWDTGWIGPYDRDVGIPKRLQIEGDPVTLVATDAGGNVGIGTTGPSEKLHIDAGSIFVNGEGQGVIVDAVGLKRVGFMKYFGKEGMLIGDASLGLPIRLGRWSGGTIKSPTTITEDLVISGTDYVGIGTTSPVYKLDVEGDVQAHAYYTGDIFFQKDDQKLWRMFEDEDGLYLENLKTGKVYRFVLQEVEKK